MPQMLCRQNRAIYYLGDDVLELGLRIKEENAHSRSIYYLGDDVLDLGLRIKESNACSRRFLGK